mmetsp:Transcript_852/g.1049  ORF Transcript_852/g.1049 Transcript_852/m.1049 type:complete len:253 (+) Transcript_852:234-992(+)
MRIFDYAFTKMVILFTEHEEIPACNFSQLLYSRFGFQLYSGPRSNQMSVMFAMNSNICKIKRSNQRKGTYLIRVDHKEKISLTPIYCQVFRKRDLPGKEDMKIINYWEERVLKGWKVHEIQIQFIIKDKSLTQRICSNLMDNPRITRSSSEGNCFKLVNRKPRFPKETIPFVSSNQQKTVMASQFKDVLDDYGYLPLDLFTTTEFGTEFSPLINRKIILDLTTMYPKTFRLVRKVVYGGHSGQQLLVICCRV